MGDNRQNFKQLKVVKIT